MHSFLSRANAIFAFVTFVTVAITVGNILTKYTFSVSPTANIRVNSIDKFRKHFNTENDQAFVVFDLDADLTSLFHWNTKQLFVFVTAEYETKANPLNQVVLWDRIITTKENSKFNLTAEGGEYLLADQGVGLRSNDITLTFNWNVIPISGLLTQESAGSMKFTLPAEYKQ